MLNFVILAMNLMMQLIHFILFKKKKIYQTKRKEIQIFRNRKLSTPTCLRSTETKRKQNKMQSNGGRFLHATKVSKVWKQHGSAETQHFFMSSRQLWLYLHEWCHSPSQPPHNTTKCFPIPKLSSHATLTRPIIYESVKSSPMRPI